MTIDKPSESALRTLWETGVPLEAAWCEFAFSVDQFILMMLGRDPEKDVEVFEDPRYEMCKDRLPKTLDERRLKLETITAEERANLLNRLKAGELWAAGYRTLPNGNDELVRVPRRLFYANDQGKQPIRLDIDWNSGEIVVSGDAYFDVHVHRPPGYQPPGSSSGPARQSEIQSPPARSEESEEMNTEEYGGSDGDSAKQKLSGKKLGGRPNTRDQIRALAKELLTTDVEFQNLSHRYASSRIARSFVWGGCAQSRRYGGLPHFSYRQDHRRGRKRSLTICVNCLNCVNSICAIYTQ